MLASEKLFMNVFLSAAFSYILIGSVCQCFIMLIVSKSYSSEPKAMEYLVIGPLNDSVLNHRVTLAGDFVEHSQCVGTH